MEDFCEQNSLGKHPYPRDKLFSFADMRADGGIECAVFPRGIAVTQCIAIAEWRAALVRLLRYGSGDDFLVFRIQFGRTRPKSLTGLHYRLRRKRAFSAIGPHAPPSLFRNCFLSRTGHPPHMGTVGG
jgi:hypothetical protein